MTEADETTNAPVEFDEAGPWAHQNWRAFQLGGVEELTQEYALYSDAWFTGHWVSDKSPYQILNMIATTESDRVSRVALTLRVAVHQTAPMDEITSKVIEMGIAARTALSGKGPKPKTDTARYHGGDARRGHEHSLR